MKTGSKRPVLRLHSAEASPSAAVSPRDHTPGPPATAHPHAQRPGVLRPALRISDPDTRTVDPLVAKAMEALERTRSHQVAIENRLASGMTPDDARWVFARRVAEQLEGGTAALLTPEKRRRLVATARRVGLRDFDASLIIALVQDGRRSGRGGLNLDVERALTMIRPADAAQAARGWPDWVRIALSALMLAGIMAWALKRWIAG